MCEAKGEVVWLIPWCTKERLWDAERTRADLDEDLGFEELLG